MTGWTMEKAGGGHLVILSNRQHTSAKNLVKLSRNEVKFKKCLKFLLKHFFTNFYHIHPLFLNK